MGLVGGDANGCLPCKHTLHGAVNVNVTKPGVVKKVQQLAPGIFRQKQVVAFNLSHTQRSTSTTHGLVGPCAASGVQGDVQMGPEQTSAIEVRASWKLHLQLLPYLSTPCEPPLPTHPTFLHVLSYSPTQGWWAGTLAFHVLTQALPMRVLQAPWKPQLYKHW